MTGKNDGNDGTDGNNESISEHDRESVADVTDSESTDSESTDSGITDEALAALIDEQRASDESGESVVDGGQGADQSPAVEISEEALVDLIAQRDDYLDQLQRAKAEFANARRRIDERAAQQKAQAAANLVEKLLPVLDSCEIALGQGIEEIRPIHDALFEVLSSQGLERVEAAGEPFDPELHEAVLYEAGEGEQVVIETLRTGYRWNQRVLRAAMVKVQG